MAYLSLVFQLKSRFKPIRHPAPYTLVQTNCKKRGCQRKTRRTFAVPKEQPLSQGVEKPLTQAGQKGPRCEAREKPTSAGVLEQYVGATPFGAGRSPARSSATIITAGLGGSRRADASSEEHQA